MTGSTKAIVITGSILLLSATAALAFGKRKKISDGVKKTVKKVGSIVWPEDADESIRVNEDGTDIIKLGTSGRYVEQLQDVLNDIHKGTVYINNNCNSVKWQLFSKWQPTSDGNILPVTGKFDSKTADVSQFYLYRKEVELDYLFFIKEKIAAYKNGDRCIYPLSEQRK